jgi:hypothetical protein
VNIRNTLAALTLILFLNISCKDEIIPTDAHLTATTDKSVYNSGQLITVDISNFTNKTVYINQCGESFHQTLIKIDSSSSGGGSFTMVCRQLTNFELRTGE